MNWSQSRENKISILFLPWRSLRMSVSSLFNCSCTELPTDMSRVSKKVSYNGRLTKKKRGNHRLSLSIIVLKLWAAHIPIIER